MAGRAKMEKERERVRDIRDEEGKKRKRISRERNTI